MSVILTAPSSFARSLFLCHPSIARVSRYKPVVPTQGFVTSATPSHRRRALQVQLRALKPAGPLSVSRTERIVSPSPSALTTSQRRPFISAFYSFGTMTIEMPTTQTDIIAQLPSRFDQAKEAGDLFFFPSTVHKHQAHGVEVCESVLCLIDIGNVCADCTCHDIRSLRSRYALR